MKCEREKEKKKNSKKNMSNAQQEITEEFKRKRKDNELEINDDTKENDDER